MFYTFAFRNIFMKKKEEREKIIGESRIYEHHKDSLVYAEIEQCE